MKATRHGHSHVKPMCRALWEDSGHDTSGRPSKGVADCTQRMCFDTQKLTHVKCSLVCPMESQNCCMAHVLSQQDNVKNQSLMLETLIRKQAMNASSFQSSI